MPVGTTGNFQAPAGALGFSAAAAPTLAVNHFVTSSGDGAITTAIPLPGRLLINQQPPAYTNIGTTDLLLWVLILRTGRSFVTSAPNAIQIRDAYEHSVTGIPTVPDVQRTLRSEEGGAIDRSTNNNAQPLAGKLRLRMGASTMVETLTLKPGVTFRIHYRSYVWTPPPWSNNANAGAPEHSVVGGSSRIQVWTFPTRNETML